MPTVFRSMPYRRILATLLACIGLHASAETLRVEQAYVRGLPPGQTTTAAFMTLVNQGDKDVVIDGGASPLAERVEIHAHRHDGGMMRMEQVPSITVKSGGQFVLAPGQYHLMLIGLQHTPREGEQVPLRLLSGDDTVLDIELPVRSVLNEHRH